MAQAGYTPIQLYLSTTASAVPSAGNLANGELAINITDGKLFYKDNGGVVQVLATKGAGTIGGSNTQVQYNSSGALAGSANLTFDGTTLTAAGLAGPHNGTVGATTPNTGAFTTLSASSTVSGAGFSTYFASPPAIGGTAANTGAFTTLTVSNAVTLSAGTANGVPYLNASKVLTTGSALTFDGTGLFSVVAASGVGVLQVYENSTGNNNRIQISQIGTVTTYNSTFSAGSGAHAWQLGGSEQARLTSSGFGVGQSNPTAKLQIKGGTTIASLTDWNSKSNSMFELANPAVRFGIGYDSSDQVLLQAFDSANGARSLNLQVYGGNVGIGTSSPDYQLDVSGTSTSTTTLGVGISVENLSFTTNTRAGIVFRNGDNYGSSIWSPRTGSSAGALVFGTNGGGGVAESNIAERARIDNSGNLLVGTTNSGLINSNGIVFNPNGNSSLFQHINGTASGTGYIVFGYNGSIIGSITQSGTAAVLYNVTSDQRLKGNIVDADDASALIDAIQVRKYDWKSDGTHQRYGFVAQELLTVAPEAVHQPADPEEMMAVDYSKLVPMLVKEIQSLRKRLAAAGI